MVAGVVVGISLAVLIVILIIWLVFRKKEKKKYEEEETPNEIRYSRQRKLNPGRRSEASRSSRLLLER